MLERVLPSEDADISRLVERGLKKQGMAIHTGTPVADVSQSEDGVSISYGEQRGEFDYLVIAAGRGADTEALGLTAAAVETDERGLIRVDGAMRTSRAGIYAIGDLVPGPALAHKASDEGSSRPRRSRACRRIRSPTATSRGRPSAPPTSARSA